MEPDEDLHELKICDEHPGYTNFSPASLLQHERETTSASSSTHGTTPPSNDTTSASISQRSTPFAAHQIPLSSATRVRAFLQETMPHLASRPFTFTRICWCADTPDREFLITTHPRYPSLVLGVGGSGHGFAHLPSVGGFIVDEMQGRLGRRFREVWKWRPETAVKRDWSDVQGRWGVERRVADFGEVKEWVGGSGQRL